MSPLRRSQHDEANLLAAARRRVATLFIFVSAAALLLATVSSISQASTEHATAACVRGDVTLHVAGATTCVPVARVFPRPRSGDEQTQLIALALSSAAAPIVKAPSVSSIAGPSRSAIVSRAFALALKRADALRKSRKTQSASSTESEEASIGCAPSAAGPGGGVIPTKTDDYTTSPGAGSTLATQITTGAAGTRFGMDFNSTKDGKQLHVHVEYQACELDLPTCPTAQGVVEGTDTSAVTVTTTLGSGSSVNQSATTQVTTEARVVGHVGEDAQLSSVDLNTTERDSHVTGGSDRTVGGGTNATITRHTTIDMPSGSYDPSGAAANVSQTLHGPHGAIVSDPSDLADAAAAFQASSAPSFATLVSKVLSDYRSGQAGWIVPNTCVTMHLAPASYTLHPAIGIYGKLRASLIAKRGGNPTPLLSARDEKRVIIKPGEPDADHPFLTYLFTEASGKSGASALIRATSRAGVADSTWEQGTSWPKYWRGTFTLSYPARAIDVPAGEPDWTESATVLYKIVPVQTLPGTIEYRAVSGTATASTTRGDCTGSPLTFSVDTEHSYMTIQPLALGAIYVADPEWLGATWEVQCMNGGTTPFPVTPPLPYMGTGGVTAAPTARMLSGTVKRDPDDEHHASGHWELVAVG